MEVSFYIRLTNFDIQNILQQEIWLYLRSMRLTEWKRWEHMLVLVAVTLCLQCTSEAQQAQSGWKLRGVSLENPPNPISTDDISALAATGATSVAVIPYAFMGGFEKTIQYNSDRQWWGERPEGCREIIRFAHQQGLSVMVKPQVWIRGLYTGDFLPASPEIWRAWQETYTAYILEFAEIAQGENAAVFCIGTEFLQLATTYPEFWSALIVKVRTVYKGKLVYAANWDEYELVSFWGELDLVGVNAYFPLSNSTAPNITEIIGAWQPIKRKLSSLSAKLKKPIVFTEFGYRSVDGGVWEHWNITATRPNLEIQEIGYAALFDSFWSESWCAGGYWWKWHFHSNSEAEHVNNDFSPQGKPAMAVIKARYQRK